MSGFTGKGRSAKGQLAHLWVEHNFGEPVKQIKKNNGQGSNFWYDGDTIFSYGRHFAIARAYKVTKGQPAHVLFTRKTYSVTTGAHISAVRNALQGRDGVEVYYVNDPTSPSLLKWEKEYYEKASYRAFEQSSKARGRAPRLYADGVALIEEGNRLSKAFKLGWTLKVPANFEALKAEVAKKEAKEQKAHEKRLARARVWEQGFQGLWLKGMETDEESFKALGVRPSLHYGERNEIERTLPTVCRIEGAEVVTSRGARVPLADAKKVLGLVEKYKGTGLALGESRVRVGAFALESIEADGTVKIGCHIIQGGEVARMAELLKGV